MVILAKDDETLMEHTENTLKVLKSLKESFPKIPKICGVNDFWNHLFYSLFLHDFGKASTEFQDVLNGNSDKPYWNYRHEVISTCFVKALNLDNESLYAIMLGIITHHKDIFDLEKKYSGFDNENSPEIDIFYRKLNTLKDNFDELISYFDLVPSLSQKYLGYILNKPNKIDFDELEELYSASVTKYIRSKYDYELGFVDDKTEIQSSYGIFLKGFITTCDHLASAGIYKILNSQNTFKSLNSFDTLRTTQKITSKTKGSAFLIAPTGSGKTEASLLWAINNQTENNSRRLFYFLPYTASINAMYERFTYEFNEETVGLLHGKAAYYLYNELSNGTYDEKKKKVKELRNLTKKIYKPYKILTPFQIIRYFFQTKGYEMGLSELANSLLIFDEIHAYNPNTVALILSVLSILKKEYDVDILIMSATLPSFIIEMFKEELNINNIIRLPEDEIDSFTRHKVEIIEGNIFDYVDDIIIDLKNNKRVLVVCNTVKNAQDIYQQLDWNNSELLHGRFILKDRQIIESKLDNLDLLVGTQSIEVSLDISYDILYTEPAPFDALIQRFGRINRIGWKENILKKVKVCTIGSDNDKYIYDMNKINKTIQLLSDIDVLYESQIQEILDEVYSEGYVDEDLNEFNNVQKSFGKLYDNLFAFKPEASKENYFKLFNQVEVVPYLYHEEYCKLINEKKYYESIAYNLSITYKQFCSYKNNIIHENDTFFIDIPYDSKLGLKLYDKNYQEKTELL